MVKKPNLFIVGHTRSGTTSLTSYLDQHPDVFMIHNKKGYFGFETEYGSEEEYLEVFSNAQNEKIIAEKCTDYLLCPDTAEKLNSFSPDSKIIIMLRNPIEQTHSLHRYLLNETLETCDNFQDALKAEESRKKESNSKKYSPHIFYREQMKYSKMVKRYLDIFGKDQVMVIILDDLKNNVSDVYKKICTFLNIDSTFKPEFEVKNASRAYRSKKLQIIFKTTPESIKKFIRKIPFSQNFYKKINYPEKKIPTINPKLKQQLQQEMLPEITILSRLLNRDLTFWCKQ